MRPAVKNAANARARPVEVWCLCAAWCDICNAYRDTYTQVCAKIGVQAHWVDVEDEADIVDPLDIEEFPTLLIASADNAQALFLGPVLSRAAVLRHFIERAAGRELAALPAGDAAHALVLRLRSRTQTQHTG